MRRSITRFRMVGGSIGWMASTLASLDGAIPTAAMTKRLSIADSLNSRVAIACSRNLICGSIRNLMQGLAAMSDIVLHSGSLTVRQSDRIDLCMPHKFLPPLSGCQIRELMQRPKLPPSRTGKGGSGSLQASELLNN